MICTFLSLLLFSFFATTRFKVHQYLVEWMTESNIPVWTDWVVNLSTTGLGIIKTLIANDLSLPAYIQWAGRGPNLVFPCQWKPVVVNFTTQTQTDNTQLGSHSCSDR